MYREQRTKSCRITLCLNDEKFDKWQELIKKEGMTSQEKLESYVDTELSKLIITI